MSKLDLHGVKHQDVKRKVIRLIEDHWDSGDTLKVITGNSDKMKDIVISVVKEYKLNFSEGDFFNPNVINIHT